MEWDVIANRWAAMTHRLRSDRINGLRNVGGAQDTRRATKGADGEVSEGMPLGTTVDKTGNDDGSRLIQ